MFIELKKVSKTYINGDIKTEALKSIDLNIQAGEFVVVLGPSGSGKSTLLNVLGGLDHCSQGEVLIDNERLDLMDQKRLTQFRRDHIGFIFQQYNLLQTLTVKENVDLGAYIAKKPFDVSQMIEHVGLSTSEDKYPYQMSGGEQQRVSIARALVKNPKVLFCDEPTGALDEKTGKGILKLLQDLNQTYQTTILLITHNPAIAHISDRMIKMNSGQIVEDIKNPLKMDALSITWS
jgi:putative ABC transport system ATP-binding protein